ncbi:MAG: Ig-like domain-containing protein [Ignavibacteriales bacterium]|nr:Ig-like domain-containing protein [Ignavibacteriales bacterium]
MKKSILTFVCLFSTSFGQNSAHLISAFESTAAEFNVPADILKGIAFAETRWQHLEWAEGDTASCAGMPRAYGVMSLRNDAWFGNSLQEAALLIGQSDEILRKDFAQNIRGAAALLRKLYDELPVPEGTARGEIESWQNAIASYSGIPQPELAHQHALDIYERLSRGYHQFGIELNARPINLPPLRQRVARIQEQALQEQTQRLSKKVDQPDYPGAKWAQAYQDHWYTTGYARDFVVIHDMEGYYLAVISYFQQSSTQASAHYCINGLKDNANDGPAGEITQMVEEKYWAWHARCWNRYSLGIEHEGFVSNPAWYTPEMYIASAALTKYMCEKYNIPKDRNHIIAHQEPTCNTHTDPGQFWDWDFYMQLVRQDTIAPRVTSTPPAGRVQVFESISITFDQRMEENSVELNFSITPDIPGSLAWSTDNRTLSFRPNAYFEFDSSYTVTIDTGARNYLGIGIDQDGDGVASDVYSFSFQTVESDTIPPQVTSVYPANNQNSISLSVEPIIQFNEPLDPATLSGAFELRETGGAGVPVTGLSSSSGFGYTRVRFRPVSDLKALSQYEISINQQAKDFGGNSIASSQTVSFMTDEALTLTGAIIDALDVIGGWWQPGTSGSTTTNLVQASFGISTDTKKSGSGSGMLTYTFTQSSGGYIREHNSSTPSIEGGSIFGAWVRGDNSGNTLEYWFYYPGGAGYIVITLTPINWTGWKLITMSTSLVPLGSGTGRRFASFGVKQINGAQTNGVIYFDQLTVGNAITGAEETIPISVPSNFQLYQNYPNPFNPSTMIRFDVARESRVRVVVYNTLGQQIETLVDEVRNPGTYAIPFSTTKLPSGVYFYRLETQGYSETKKMILMR